MTKEDGGDYYSASNDVTGIQAELANRDVAGETRSSSHDPDFPHEPVGRFRS